MPQAPPGYMYIGDGLSVGFEYGHLILFMAQDASSLVMAPASLRALQSFIAGFTQPDAAGEVDVWHEGTAYRAILLRKLTLDEIYQGLK